jgi:YXWGXW repeat-containing protein
MAYQRNTPPPPSVYLVVEIGAPGPTGHVVLVDAPPPPLQEELIPGRPGPHHVWIAGHWRYRNGHYLWVHGRWEVPPRPRARFVAPRWEERGGSHVFVEGYWQVV